MPSYNSQYLIGNDGYIYEVICCNYGMLFILDQLYVAKIGNNLKSFPVNMEISADAIFEE